MSEIPMYPNDDEDREWLEQLPAEHDKWKARAEKAEARLREVEHEDREVDAWRSGYAAAFGGVTANPHASLVGISNRLEEHHQEHHTRERALEALLREAKRNLEVDTLQAADCRRAIERALGER